MTRPGRDDIDPDRELIAVGAANVGASVCAGMVVSGSLSKTAVNGDAGARSQASGLVTAVLTVVTLLLLTGLFEELPEATLGAIVIVAVVELIDIPALRRLYRIWTSRLGAIYGLAARVDFLAALAALLGVLVFGTLPGLFIGIAVSVVLLVYRASRPNAPCSAHAGPIRPGSIGRATRRPSRWRVSRWCVWRRAVLRQRRHVRTRIRRITESADPRAVVLDAETSPSIDVTGAQMLADLAQHLRRCDTRLLVARDVGQVRDVLRRVEVPDIAVGVYPTVDAAVAAALAGMMRSRLSMPIHHLLIRASRPDTQPSARDGGGDGTAGRPGRDPTPAHRIAAPYRQRLARGRHVDGELALTGRRGLGHDRAAGAGSSGRWTGAPLIFSVSACAAAS